MKVFSFLPPRKTSETRAYSKRLPLNGARYHSCYGNSNVIGPMMNIAARICGAERRRRKRDIIHTPIALPAPREPEQGPRQEISGCPKQDQIDNLLLADISDLMPVNRSHPTPTRARSGRGSSPHRSRVEIPLRRPGLCRAARYLLACNRDDCSWHCVKASEGSESANSSTPRAEPQLRLGDTESRRCNRDGDRRGS